MKKNRTNNQKTFKAQRLAFLAFSILAFTSQKSFAFTYAFQDFVGVKFGGSTVTTTTEFALGYFTGALTTTGPTLSLANFTNLNLIDADAGTIGFSNPLDFGDPAAGNPLETFVSVGTAPMDANTGGLKPSAGTQLYLVGKRGSDFAFAISNPIWVVKTNSFSDTGGATYDWDSNVNTDPVEGFAMAYATFFTPNVEFTSNASGNLISVIPEPTTGSMMILGLSIIPFLRKVLKRTERSL